MKITIAGEILDCIKAVRAGNSAQITLADGRVVNLFGVQSFDALRLTEGEWEIISPLPSNEERLAALESAMMAMMMGGTGNV